MLVKSACKISRRPALHRPQIISRAIVCLTFSVVASSIPAWGFEALHKSHALLSSLSYTLSYPLSYPLSYHKTHARYPSQWHRTMATTDLSIESADNSPTKMLLHDRDADIYERDLIGTVTPPSANSLKIISWNVAGLRGTMKKHPEVLNELVDKQNPDILCLQVQFENIPDIEVKLMLVCCNYHRSN